MMVLALISGLILGIIFFGGLWLTVKKSLGKTYAVLWFLASSVIRTAIVLAGFYFVAQGSLPRLLTSVAGFIAARFLVLWLTKQFEQKQLISTESNQS